MLLKDELRQHVMDNLKEIVQVARKHNVIDQTFQKAMTDHVFIGPAQYQLKGHNPLMGLADYGLIEVAKWGGNQPIAFAVTLQGERAVDADFEIELVDPFIDVDIQHGDRYTVSGDIINSNIAIGPEAVAITKEQVLSDLGNSNPALTEAIEELARAISDKPDDRPDILSKLSHVMKLLSQAHGLVEMVAPMVIKALKVVDLLP